MMHVDVETGQHDYLEKQENPRAIEQRRNVKCNGTTVESKQVGIGHQWATAFQQLFLNIWNTGISLHFQFFILFEKTLEIGRTLLLIVAIITIERVEQTVEPFLFREDSSQSPAEQHCCPVHCPPCPKGKRDESDGNNQITKPV